MQNDKIYNNCIYNINKMNLQITVYKWIYKCTARANNDTKESVILAMTK